jgi:hypothetical protein
MNAHTLLLVFKNGTDSFLYQIAEGLTRLKWIVVNCRSNNPMIGIFIVWDSLPGNNYWKNIAGYFPWQTGS